TESPTRAHNIINDLNEAGNVNKSKTQTPPELPKEQSSSLSKSMTRKAAATITRIQRLSKATDTTVVNESTSSTDNSLDGTIRKALEGSENKGSPCKCEFCKVILSYFLPSKKAKSGKRSKYRASNVDNEECKLLPSLGTRRHILQLLEKKAKRLARHMLRQKAKPLTLGKGTALCHALPTKPIIKFSLSEPKNKNKVNETHEVAVKAPHEMTTSSKNFLNAMQQLKTPSAPVKVIGNTGYFVLTGTKDELAVQLAELEEDHNVLIRRCRVLMPGVPDAVEPQLEHLEQHREEILQQMHAKHEMLEPRRQRRVKRPSKYH
ncbi:hypothetical protein KR215_002989, partial [Drosophila sulfurigaster]